MLGITFLAMFPQWGSPLESTVLKGALVTAIVTDLDGNVLFEKNADTRVMPASNQKLFSCAYALAKRGPNGTNKTRFWMEGNTLFVDAEGDPTIAASTLQSLRSQLKIKTSTRVRVRQSYALARPSTWQLQDVPNRYAPAVHAFSADKAGFELWAGPGGLSFEPHRPANLNVVFQKAKSAISLVEYSPLNSKLIVSGTLPSSRIRIDTLSDPHPSSTAVALLTGGSGTFAPTDSVPSRTPDRALTSPPISKLIKDCLQPSDNCLAEHLFVSTSQAKSYEGASQGMTTWLKNVVGVDTAYVRIEDGSGLSRKDQTTPRTIAKLLKWCYEHPTRGLWLSSLASPSSGTLSSRLNGVDFQGKTGTLDMVSALSGYVKCTNGETRIISVILNHYGCSERQARDTIDEFIRNVSEQNLSGTVFEGRNRNENGVPHLELGAAAGHRRR